MTNLREIDFRNDDEWAELARAFPLLELLGARPRTVFGVDLTPPPAGRPLKVLISGDPGSGFGDLTAALGGETIVEDLRRFGVGDASSGEDLFDELTHLENDRFLFAQLGLVNVLRAKLTHEGVTFFELPVFSNPTAWFSVNQDTRDAWDAFLLTTALALNRAYDLRVVYLWKAPPEEDSARSLDEAFDDDVKRARACELKALGDTNPHLAVVTADDRQLSDLVAEVSLLAAVWRRPTGDNLPK